MDAIGPVSAGRVGLPAAPSAAPAETRSFREVLQESIDRVGRLQAEADGTLEKMRLGQATEAEAMAAIHQARLAMDAMTEIRNRIVAAFTEIQSMRV